jgi:hypothetical protein
MGMNRIKDFKNFLSERYNTLAQEAYDNSSPYWEGDRVQHKQDPSIKGEVIKIHGPNCTIKTDAGDQKDFHYKELMDEVKEKDPNAKGWFRRMFGS